MKRFLFLSLCIFQSIICSQERSYYALIVNISKTNACSQQIWNKTISLIKALAQQYQQTAKVKTAEEFHNDIVSGIATIRQLFAISQDEPGLSIDANVFYKSYQAPEDDLSVCFEFICDESTPAENQEQIRSLMADLEKSCNSDNQNNLLDKLANLELIFELLSGKSSVGVNCFE